MTDLYKTGGTSPPQTAREERRTIEPPLTSKQAAALLQCHPKTLERKAREEQLPGHFKLGRWYFYASELDAWLRDTLDSPSQSVREN